MASAKPKPADEATQAAEKAALHAKALELQMTQVKLKQQADGGATPNSAAKGNREKRELQMQERQLQREVEALRQSQTPR